MSTQMDARPKPFPRSFQGNSSPMSRTRRAVVGALCMVAAALVMGWFVGRYIPGTPQMPEPPLADGLSMGSQQMAKEIIESERGSNMQLHNIVQGEAFGAEASSSQNDIELLKSQGLWEIECPDISLSVTETRSVDAAALFDWYPISKSNGEQAYPNTSTIVAVTVLLTNASQETLSNWRSLPQFVLWSENLAHIDGSMGAGVAMDPLFFEINSRSHTANTESSIHDAIVYIEPGQTKELVLPFKINKNNLKDQSSFDNLDLSSFCLQTSDYATATTYRLWL